MTQGAPLSEWLELMLAEVARKREELERARAEQRTREHEAAAARDAASARTELT
ncbi:MAG TPA: hypothetical protein VMG11_05720 [Steroidobacteraceae bacterium]|nr:hypothetical protein [Steroidobacteraceae bacterium]